MSGILRINSPTPFVGTCSKCGEKTLQGELDQNDGICQQCYDSLQEEKQ